MAPMTTTLLLLTAWLLLGLLAALVWGRFVRWGQS